MDNEIVDDPLASVWDAEEVWADEFDAWCNEPGTWVPPNFGGLVRAVRATILRRFSPFTSHEYFCLAAGPRFWIDESLVAPVFIGRTRDHGYHVWSGHLFDASGFEVLVTDDAREAAGELERLLDGWTPA